VRSPQKAAKYVGIVWMETVRQLMFGMPRFRCINFLKSSFLRSMGAEIGRRVVFYPGVWISTGRSLRIGDDVDLALQVIITTDGGVEIGERTLIGYRTQILSQNHRVPALTESIFDSGVRRAPVTIGRDVWIGANCVILPGVTIGEGAVIGAGSVVVRDLPPFVIAAGTPARVIRHRTALPT